MVRHASLFSQLVALFNRGQFHNLVFRHKAERFAKAFNSWDHFVAMLFCQLARAKSLREICGGLLSCCVGKLRHLGVNKALNKSTLSYANAHRPWKNKIILWGSLHDINKKNDTFRFRWRRWIKNEHWLNSFLMTNDMMAYYISYTRKFTPFLILGYAESIYEFARFVERSGSYIHSPMALMTSAGTLFPEMRTTLERAFKSQVFNRYGTREVSNITCECSSRRFACESLNPVH